MKKKIFTQEKIAEEMKGILTQKKQQQQRAGWKLPTPAKTFLMRHPWKYLPLAMDNFVGILKQINNFNLPHKSPWESEAIFVIICNFWVLS